MGKVIALSKIKRLTGTWKSCDAFSNIEFSVQLKGNAFIVSITDRDDGEIAEVQNVAWDERALTLSFSAYWQSSGRLTKYRVMPSPDKGRAQVTYTYTAQDLWEKV
jgi:hypothetical protein